MLRFTIFTGSEQEMFSKFDERVATCDVRGVTKLSNLDIESDEEMIGTPTADGEDPRNFLAWNVLYPHEPEEFSAGFQLQLTSEE